MENRKLNSRGFRNCYKNTSKNFTCARSDRLVPFGQNTNDLSANSS